MPAANRNVAIAVILIVDPLLLPLGRLCRSGGARIGVSYYFGRLEHG